MTENRSAEEKVLRHRYHTLAMFLICGLFGGSGLGIGYAAGNVLVIALSWTILGMGIAFSAIEYTLITRKLRTLRAKKQETAE